MSTMYFDVATTRFRTDKATGEVPRILRLAWWMDDDSPKERPNVRLIRPPVGVGVTIDPKTYEFHRISLQDCVARGHPLPDVLKEFQADWLQATERWAFFAEFHTRALDRAFAGCSITPPPGNALCLMARATPVLKLPAMRPGGGYKAPSRAECCAHFSIRETESTIPEISGQFLIISLAQIKTALDQAPPHDVYLSGATYRRQGTPRDV